MRAFLSEPFRNAIYEASRSVYMRRVRVRVRVCVCMCVYVIICIYMCVFSLRVYGLSLFRPLLTPQPAHGIHRRGVAAKPD